MSWARELKATREKNALIFAESTFRGGLVFGGQLKGAWFCDLVTKELRSKGNKPFVEYRVSRKGEWSRFGKLQ